jgi:hypothetical protein
VFTGAPCLEGKKEIRVDIKGRRCHTSDVNPRHFSRSGDYELTELIMTKQTPIAWI